MRWAMSTDWTVYVDKLPMPFIPASRRLPLHPAEVPGAENDEPERNPVPGEHLEIVAAHIAYQGAHGERCAHEGRDRTDPDDGEIVEPDGVPGLEKLQHRCAEYRRNRQEK